MPDHRIRIADDDAWDREAAATMAEAIGAALARRGRCVVAISGGSTPMAAFRHLASHRLDWSNVVITQVDERIVPVESGERNLIAQQRSLAATGAGWLPLPADRLVELDWDSPSVWADAVAIVDDYSRSLTELAGEPPVIDVAHLGLGVDGHTASLFPGDDLTNQLRTYVGVAEPVDRSRRISLTRAVLDRTRLAVWLVSGSEKAAMLARLVAGDRSIPAGLVSPAESVIVADRSAANRLSGDHRS